MSKLEYDIMRDYEKFNEATSKAAQGGANTLELLTIVFVVLKLCHIIDWPWVWVLSPIWIPLILLVIILMAIIVIDLIIN